METMDALLGPSPSWATTVFYKPVWAVKFAGAAIPFIARNRDAVVRPRIFDFHRAVRADPVTKDLKLGSTGYCWGGKYTIHLCQEEGMVDAGFAAHPSKMAFPEDWNKIVKPLAVAIGDVDMVIGIEDVKRIEGVLREKKDVETEVRVYEGAKHGFAVRADPKDEGQTRSAVESIVVMANTNEGVAGPEKGVDVGPTEPQNKDVVAVDNKEIPSLNEGHDSEIPSEEAAQTAVDVPTSEPPSETPVEPTDEYSRAYSVFTVTQKKMIVTTASLASLFSPMATAIYYPSLTTMAKDLHVSDAKINLTVTLFLVIQGIAPAFFADIADRAGRRPVYAMCYFIFNAANIGLALQNNYTALLILRMVQSAGSSSTVSLANGVVGDIITSAERGTYIAFASLAGIFGPMIAPVLGGAIAQYAGWHFLFWFQLIFSSAVYIPLLLFMPETCRSVVDDGSIPPPYWSRNFTDAVRHRNRAKRGLVVDTVKQEEIRKKYRIGFPNPLATLRVVTDRATAIILICTGVGIGCFYAISTGAATVFSKHYNFNPLQISLMFIPIGAGSVLSALTSGRLIDWNYRRHAHRLGITVVKNKRQDLRNFPIETARLQVGFPMLFLAGAAVLSC
ncbi:hypothetical protein V492_02740 [Pseudogymnoascus sp. VKM F-4246]|nr:hypothetical protein V492_02740 [Pseudogymnoascus sp. VKM F-4246]